MTTFKPSFLFPVGASARGDSRKNSTKFIRFMGYVKPYWKDILLTIIGGIVKFTVPLLAPQVTRHLLDDVFLNPAMTTQQKMNEVYLYAGGMIVIFVVFWMPWTYVRHYYASKAGHQSVFDLRCDLYDHILRMSSSFFDRNRSGSIVSRLISDIALAQNLVGSALTNVWMDAISLVFILYFMFSIDVPSTWVALATFPLYIFSFRGLSSRIRESTLIVQEKIAHLSGAVQEKISGNVIVHAFSQEKREEREFLAESNQLLDVTFKQAYYQSLNMTINGVLVSIAPLIVTIYSGWRVIQGTLSVGDMVAIGLYLGPLYLPVQRFSELNIIFANSMAALDRIFAVMDEAPEVRNRDGAQDLTNPEGVVTFEQVHFAYPNTTEEDRGPVLADISFEALPGQKVAFVGPSGAGKSTIVSLIPRFYDVCGGAIRIDGQDIRNLELKSLRRQIGMVLQDPILFSGSILDNLRYGRPEASMEEVYAACRAANALGFIETFPAGFHTEVGEGGSFLSGGQRQRLTIARAFLSNPKILILDEATAALDAESERLVKLSLDQLMEGRTALIIAHRLSTVVNADCILVVDDGRIIEQGKHADLLAANGLYARLYHEQFQSAE